MKQIKILPEAAQLIADLLFSCGNETCDPTIQRLKRIKQPVLLSALAGPQGWPKPVFGNLQEYALSEGISELGAKEVARYFGGTYHINHMIPKSFRSNLGLLMGIEAGLVLDVLLPLEDGAYRNGDFDLHFGELVEADSDASGVPCVHRGLVVRIPLSQSEVTEILAEQFAHPEFREALSKLPTRIDFPENYLEAFRLSRA